ncbi:MAG TPA: hypothetical protein VFM25_06455 [Verrucomicrobiae bacterium]|nr:hypothetical protein [Verrucomicrobiae bacterium]
MRQIKIPQSKPEQHCRVEAEKIARSKTQRCKGRKRARKSGKTKSGNGNRENEINLRFDSCPVFARHQRANACNPPRHRSLLKGCRRAMKVRTQKLRAKRADCHNSKK